jgi:hypothetical protein
VHGHPQQLHVAGDIGRIRLHQCTAAKAALANPAPRWPTWIERAEDLRAFARRDFIRVDRAKQEFWAQQYALHGPSPAIRAAAMLRRHVMAQTRSSLSSERRQDLAHHIHLKRRIDAASAWFRC